MSFGGLDLAQAREKAEGLGALVLRACKAGPGLVLVEVRLDQAAKDAVAIAVYTKQCRFSQISVLERRAC